MRSLSVFTLFAAAVLWLAQYLQLPHLHSKKWIILAFLFLLSLVVIWAQERVARNHPKDWVVYYLGIIVGRLLSSVCFIGYFIFSKEPGLFDFIANFFVLYLSYTGFEIYALLANLRRNSIS